MNRMSGEREPEKQHTKSAALRGIRGVTAEESWFTKRVLMAPSVYRGTKLVHRIVSETSYLIGVEEAQNRYGQLGEEDQCQAEGELERRVRHRC